MIRLSINMPKGRRLDLRFVKGRKSSNKTPLIPDLGGILRARKGSKISRYFRHIFEHEKIKRILGTNLAIMILVSSFMPVAANFDTEPDLSIITQETTPLTTEHGIQYPVKEILITQTYKLYHPGIDFDGLTGEAIYPIMTGVIEDVSYSRFAYGNAVIINHGNGITSLYAHLSEIEAKEGQEVTMDTKLGEMGATGRSFGDHLHLEVRDHGRAINPLSILPH
ncbi:M23 family metallopeptidase [Patescibacteria group bacterium]|nr:M23 family metallopeptidase [Patescibacteria group bacterium]MBU0776727.1 M23 family metallopeptidase [Patescibacteria group bacterium]MBU0846171.1 M23 family metallopeptidase [Patescibacteria group bacterium]MBU0922740.1 M23 family metallopeptidase [Patescibacteria group bacterium]MBU1066257.1 M23 family metallopeptidase [Patescibacteria group bacterium]